MPPLSLSGGSESWACCRSRAWRDLERLEGPAPDADLRIDPRGRGEGTLSKSMSDVRVTGRVDNPVRLGVAGWCVLAKYRSGPEALY